MRICLLETHPRIGGSITYQLHLRTGFRQLGHETHMCAMTKSGKPLAIWGSDAAKETATGHRSGWWPEDVDRVLRSSPREHAIAALDEYDLIVMTEPKVPNQDRDAYKNVRKPIYLEIMEKIRTPWTSIVHDHQLTWKKAPFMADLLRTPSFSGVLITRGADYWDKIVPNFYGRLPLELIRKMPVMPDLPYACSLEVDGPVPEPVHVGMTARVAPNKGQWGLCSLADRIQAPLLLFGESSQSMAPTPSFLLLEYLVEKLGWEMLTKPGRGPIKVWPWKVRTPSGNTVEYRGVFAPEDLPYSTIGAHVSITSRQFAYGRVEYVELEAMDHGCIPVFSNDDDPTNEYRCSRLFKYFEESNHDPEELLEKINEGVATMRDPVARAEVVRHNREKLRIKEDPVKFATQILAEVFGS